MRKQCVPGVSPPPSQTPGYEASLQPSGIGLPCLFVGRLAIQGSLESGASARAIVVTHGHKSTNLTRV